MLNGGAQSVDPSTETLVLSSQEECDAYSGLAKHLPRSDPGTFCVLNDYLLT